MLGISKIVNRKVFWLIIIVISVSVYKLYDYGMGHALLNDAERIINNSRGEIISQNKKSGHYWWYVNVDKDSFSDYLESLNNAFATNGWTILECDSQTNIFRAKKSAGDNECVLTIKRYIVENKKVGMKADLILWDK